MNSKIRNPKSEIRKGLALFACSAFFCGCQSTVLSPGEGKSVVHSLQSTVVAPQASVVLLPPHAETAWEASTNGMFYWVYYGPASGAYDHLVPVGTNLSATVTGLEFGRTYYFVVTETDEAGNESDFSPEAQLMVQPTLELRFDVTGDQLIASTDLMNWTPREAILAGKAWRVMMDPTKPQEFYRTQGSNP